jgi:hypothetical protein
MHLNRVNLDSPSQSFPEVFPHAMSLVVHDLDRGVVLLDGSKLIEANGIVDGVIIICCRVRYKCTFTQSPEVLFKKSSFYALKTSLFVLVGHSFKPHN